MERLLEGLNAQQREAVTWSGGSALVLAGAGSGKTRVLTSRMAWLMQTGQVEAEAVLAVTFTNKAAREMVTRLGALARGNAREWWVGTFHGLCHRFLRLHYREAGLPAQFQILDMTDQQSVIRRVLKSLHVEDDQLSLRQAQQAINRYKEQGLRAAVVERHSAVHRLIQEVYEVYERQCQTDGTVDFAELLLRCVELWQRSGALRDHYQARFKAILIDEFQDTNALQYRWLKLLRGPHAEVFAVGDDDQSIYSFRGAEVANMRHFERDFAVQKVIRLEQNYRSTGTILDAANALINHNTQRFGKTLWSDSERGRPIRLFAADNDESEARFVVGDMVSHQAEGARLSEMVVLYRSNAQSRVLEQALVAQKVPYRVYGGLRFYDRQEVRHALAYLRLVVAPDDDQAFLRVVNFPPRGIGARSLELLQQAAQEAGNSLSRSAAGMTLAGKAGQGLRQFLETLAYLRTEVESGRALADVTRTLLERSGLLDYYRQDKGGEERIANLEELISAVYSFVEQQSSDLVTFLAHASLEGGELEAHDGVDSIQMMTVHAAKGLEFERVWIVGMEDGLFPHDNALGEPRGLEEERRLAYVALTRARQHLTLSHARARVLHGQLRYGKPSRFLEEIPEALCLKLGMEQGDRRNESYHATSSLSRSPWRVGQRVRHAKFGEGTVLAFEGDGAEGRLQVNFRDFGIKWLALAFAKLTGL
ncbi:MAG: UvrD-helicase domain-containing protein [Betaproteobacteria bacterium]|jgi:ATP-dependent DNA helicase UvrD (EC 3.6.1.-)|nr:UvrD-helicase domain-containing protein [Betaproteobacteria bacterium]